jgi:hypothetical protein
VARRGGARGAVLARCPVAPSGGEFARTTCAAALAPGDANDLFLSLTFEAEAGAAGLQIDSLALVDA